jgi:hypothetical protein
MITKTKEECTMKMRHGSRKDTQHARCNKENNSEMVSTSRIVATLSLQLIKVMLSFLGLH